MAENQGIIQKVVANMLQTQSISQRLGTPLFFPGTGKCPGASQNKFRLVACTASFSNINSHYYSARIFNAIVFPVFAAIYF